jgi:hypothetical protein
MSAFITIRPQQEAERKLMCFFDAAQLCLVGLIGLIGFGAEQRTTTSEQQKSGISYIV